MKNKIRKWWSWGRPPLRIPDTHTIKVCQNSFLLYSSPSFPHKFYSVHAHCTMSIFRPTPSRFDCRFSHFTPSRFVNVHHLFLTILSLHHQGLSNWISESSRPYPYTHLFNAPILRVPLLEHPFVQFSVENSIFVTRFSPIYRIHPFMPTNILLTTKCMEGGASAPFRGKSANF